jgi:recombination protein RecT
MSSEMTVYDAVTLSEQNFKRIATNDNLVSWAEESQFATQLLNKNERLQACVPASIQESVINVASVGLTLNPSYGYAYLVPENVKVGDNRYNVCQLRISFKGLMKIATDSGGIKWVRAEIVKANDDFTYRGPFEKPEHNMTPFGDRGATVGVYCVAKTGDGDYLTDIMDLAEINKCKAAAKTKYVWDAWFEEMAKKAIIKRSSKQWPLGQGAERFHKAADIVNEVEGSEELHKERDVTLKPELVDFITQEQATEIVNACKENGVLINDLEARAGSKLESIRASRFGAAMSWIIKNGAQANA